MAAVAKVDATDVPDLRRIAEEIRDRQEPVMLRLDGQDVAIITPVPLGEPHADGVLTRDQLEILMSAAGGWRDIVDTELLKEELRRAQGQDMRPWET
jgi:type IV secretory pathway VirJ component